MTLDPWVVWSFEHNAWWKPRRRGYTPDLVMAGVYTKDEAHTIEREAAGNELALPLDGALTYPAAGPVDVQSVGAYLSAVIRNLT